MSKVRIILAVAIATGICLLGVMQGAAQKSSKPAMSQASGLLSGTVKSANGPEEGITVSARAEGSTITTSVFTDADGQYIFPSLPNGKYSVWAQAVGLATGHAGADLDGSKPVHQDFLLRPIGDIGRQMTGADWASSLPESNIQERRIKDVFLTSCAGCHQPSYPLQNKFDKNGWTAIIDLMKMVNVVGLRSRKTPLPFIEHHEADLAAYLSKVRGPEGNSWTPKIVSRPKGEATMAVITEYAIEPAETPGELPVLDGSDWSQGIPSSMNGSRGTHEVELDLAGNVWISTSQDNPTRTIAKIDAKTGQMTNIKLVSAAGKVRTSHGMRRDAKGIIWLTLSGGDASRFEAQQNGMANGVQSGTASLARLDPATGKVDIIPNPPGMRGVSNDAVEMDGKGKIWVTMNNGAMRYDPETGKFMEFKSLAQERPDGMIETYGVAGDSQGNGYWTQMALDIVGKGDPNTGKSSEIKIPPRKEKMEIVTAEDKKAYETMYAEFNSAVPWTQGPRRLSGDVKGNAVWVADFWGDNLSKIDAKTGKVTQYPATRGGGIYATVVDKNHMVWANMMNNDSVARFDPNTAKWVEYMLPTHGAESRHIAVDDRQYPPTVAVPYSRSSKVAVLRFRTKESLQALRDQVQTTKLQAQNR